MELSDFGPLIQLCAVSNFLYSAVEHFSQNVQTFFSEPFKELGNKSISRFSGKIRDINDSKVFKTTQIDTAPLKKEFDERFIELSKTIESFKKQSGSDMEYGQKFKSLYLLAGLFSFFLLIIIGLNNYLVKDKQYNCLFAVEMSLVLVSIYIFTSTFFTKFKKVRPLIIVGIMVVLIYIFKKLYAYPPYLSLGYIPSKETTIFISIWLICSPFCLHFMRILIEVILIQIQILSIKYKFYNKFKIIKKDVETLDKYLSPMAVKEAV